jgi:hypothetical protein
MDTKIWSTPILITEQRSTWLKNIWRGLCKKPWRPFTHRYSCLWHTTASSSRCCLMIIMPTNPGHGQQSIHVGCKWEDKKQESRRKIERGVDTSFVTQELNLSDTSSRLDYWNSSPFQLSNKPRRAIVTLKLFQSRTVQREWRCAVASQPTQRVFLSLFSLFSLSVVCCSPLE